MTGWVVAPGPPAVACRQGVPGVLRVRLGRHRKAWADVLVVVDDCASRSWFACADVVLCRDAASAEPAGKRVTAALRASPGAEAAVSAFPGGCALGLPDAGVRWFANRAVPGDWVDKLRSLAVVGGGLWIPRPGVELTSPGEVVACLLITTMATLDPAERGQDFGRVVRRVEAFDDR